MKFSYVVIFALLLFSYSFSSTQQISDSLRMVCSLLYTLLPIAVITGVTLSGVIFAIGQTLGAETRARANVWATQLLTGSLIAGVVTVLAPEVLSILMGGEDISKACESANAVNQTQVCLDNCNATLTSCRDNCDNQGLPPGLLGQCYMTCDAEYDQCTDKC